MLGGGWLSLSLSLVVAPRCCQALRADVFGMGFG